MAIQVSIYGKLPAHADYVVLNLPNAIEVQMHEWLSSIIFESESMLGKDTWLKAFLTTSPLCFVINFKHSEEYALFGVLVPSVDRVGRYFPLLSGVYLELNNQKTAFDQKYFANIANAIVEEQVKAMHESHTVDTLQENISLLKELEVLENEKFLVSDSSFQSLHGLTKQPIVSSLWWELDHPSKVYETKGLPSVNYYYTILSRGLSK